MGACLEGVMPNLQIGALLLSTSLGKVRPQHTEAGPSQVCQGKM